MRKASPRPCERRGAGRDRPLRRLAMMSTDTSGRALDAPQQVSFGWWLQEAVRSGWRHGPCAGQVHRDVQRARHRPCWLPWRQHARGRAVIHRRRRARARRAQAQVLWAVRRDRATCSSSGRTGRVRQAAAGAGRRSQRWAGRGLRCRAGGRQARSALERNGNSSRRRARRCGSAGYCRPARGARARAAPEGRRR